MVSREAWYREADERQMLQLDRKVLRDPTDVESAMRLWDLVKRLGESIDLEWGSYGVPQGAQIESPWRQPKPFLQGLSQRVESGQADQEDRNNLWKFALAARQFPNVSKQAALETYNAAYGKALGNFWLALKVAAVDPLGQVGEAQFFHPIDRWYLGPMDGQVRGHVGADLQEVLELANGASLDKGRLVKKTELTDMGREQADGEDNLLGEVWFIHVFWPGSDHALSQQQLAKIVQWTNA